MSDALTIAVADDNVLLRAGIVRVLEAEGWAVIAEVGNAEDLLVAVRRDLPKVVVADIRMPPGHGDEGIRATRAIRTEYGERIAVLVLSQYLEPDFAMATARAWSRFGTGSYNEALEIVRDSAAV